MHKLSALEAGRHSVLQCQREAGSVSQVTPLIQNMTHVAAAGENVTKEDGIKKAGGEV